MLSKIIKAMNTLSKKEQIFHSEADFQFRLGWELKVIDNSLEIVMERPYSNFSKRVHIDLIIIDTPNNKKYAIELKYATKFLKYTDKNDSYSLTNHNAQNQKRYDFYRDISRVEKLIQDKEINEGYTILLTNDLSYLLPHNGGASKLNFSDNHSIAPGSYKLDDTASETDKKGRTNPIKINQTISCNWKTYIDKLKGSKENQIFKYLILQIK